MRKLALIFFCLTFSFWQPVQAQASGRILLSAPDASRFPTVSAYLNITGPNGQFLSGLSAADLRLLENDQPASIQELREIQPGIQFSVAIDPGPDLAVRNTQGELRYDQIAKALQGWAAQDLTGKQDRYALYVNGAPPSDPFTDRTGWLQSFEAYQPDLHNAQPSLESLSMALDQAAPASQRKGAQVAVLWITPLPGTDLLDKLPDLSQKAQENQVHITVWMVGPQSAIDSDGGGALNQLATETGGQFFAFSGVEQLPDPETILAPLRGAYLVTYTSQARKSGTQSLVAELTTSDGTFSSQPQSFDLQVQAPNPMFVSLPTTLTRTAPADSQAPLEALAPMVQPIQVLVEFPDGYQRPLAATRLYVDGQLEAVNKKAPFTQFLWSLKPYTASGTHRLQVEAEDTLGLKKQSLEIPVEIQVTIPPETILTLITRHSTQLTWAVGGLAGLATLLLIFTGVRRRNRRLPGASRPGLIHRRGQQDPVTQTVSIAADPGRQGQPGWSDRLFGSRHASGQASAGQLVRLDENNQPLTSAPIRLAGEIIFGRDPVQANCVLESPSVEARHARLSQAPDGQYRLYDLGTVAGTWVNYAPISKEGIPLEHGDLIHIGRVGFRFVLVRPPSVPKPQVTAYKNVS